MELNIVNVEFGAKLNPSYVKFHAYFAMLIVANLEFLNKKCHMELDISNAELCGKFFSAELNIPNVKFYAKNFKKLK